MKVSDFATGIQHIGIPTNDIDKTVAFYESLGFETALSTVNEAAGERVVFLRLKNLVIETYQNNNAALLNGAIDHIAIDVQDVEKVFAMLKEQNFELLDTNVNFLPFWENGVKFFTILGPNQEKIEFSQML